MCIVQLVRGLLGDRKRIWRGLAIGTIWPIAAYCATATVAADRWNRRRLLVVSDVVRVVTVGALGMAILLDMKKKSGADEWAGQVYNAKDGKLYESTITLKSPNKLEIEGCVLGFLCGGETWTRVSGPIPSSPSNSVAELPKAGVKGKAGTHTHPAPAPKSAAKTSPPKTVGQRTAATPGTTEPEDTVGDICLIPEIARAAH